MDDERLAQLQRKRKRLQEELELSRRIGELEDEEARLLARAANRNGTHRTTEVIDLSEEFEHSTTPAAPRDDSTAPQKTSMPAPAVQREQVPSLSTVSDSEDEVPAFTRGPHSYSSVRIPENVNRRGIPQHVRRSVAKMEYAATQDFPAISTTSTTKQKPGPTTPLPQFSSSDIQPPGNHRKHNDFKHRLPFGSQSAYFTIVQHPHDKAYYELRCDLCGANCRGNGDFFTGLNGFVQHFKVVHHDIKEQVTYEGIMVRCMYRKLEDHEVEAARRGDTETYSVSRVMGDKKNQSGHRTARTKSA